MRVVVLIKKFCHLKLKLAKFRIKSYYPIGLYLYGWSSNDVLLVAMILTIGN